MNPVVGLRLTQCELQPVHDLQRVGLLVEQDEQKFVFKARQRPFRATASMALDIYSWLAQRLHRIPTRKPQFVPWKSVKDQFGWSYRRMNHFRKDFLEA